MAYRSPSKPEESDRFIRLPPHKARRFVLAFCLWFLAFWFLIWPVMWVVQALVTGEGVWRLAVAPFVWLVVPWGVTRLMRLETVLIGTQTLRRVGFVRDHVMPWSAVEKVRHFERPRTRGRPVRLIGVQGEGRELVVAPDVVEDPQAVLRWALDQATQGRAVAIDERVRAEGLPQRRMTWFVPHLATGLVLSIAVGWLLWGDQRRRHADRALRQAEEVSYEERVAIAEPILSEDGLNEFSRCRAGSILVHATLSRDITQALSYCQQMHAIPCRVMPYQATDCAPIEHFREAAAAVEENDPQRALDQLEMTSVRGPARYGIEVPALAGVGRRDEARAMAQECVDRFGDSESEATLRHVATCRAF